MKYRIFSILLSLLSVTLLQCGNPTEALYKKYHSVVSSVGELDDAKMEKYIKTMRILRQEGIQFQLHCKHYTG